MTLNCSEMVDIPCLDMDESYSLKVTPGDVNIIDIQAKTNVGIMRALETLLQLFQKRNHYCVLPAVTIDDSPQFKVRNQKEPSFTIRVCALLIITVERFVD